MRVILWASILLVGASFATAEARPRSASPPRLDALDVEAGALLAEEPESAGFGVSDGAAWHLTDGRDDAGWRSPTGAPQGASFVWELDATWRLDTLVISTRGVDDRTDRGRAVKTIELFVASAHGDWVSAGQYELGKRQRRTIMLPAGTEAARVRAVILENHGNPEVSELSELAIYGARIASLPGRAPVLTGDFRTSIGALRFVQDGTVVTGCQDAAENEPPIMLDGFASGRVVRLAWQEPDDLGGVVDRTATFTFVADRLRGTTFTDGQPDGVIWGVRVPRSRGPVCNPPLPEAPVLAVQ